MPFQPKNLAVLASTEIAGRQVKRYEVTTPGLAIDPELRVSTLINKPLIGCVWELPPLEHERSAWVRHLLEPDQPDPDAYLVDSLPAGLVGGGLATISPPVRMT